MRPASPSGQRRNQRRIIRNSRSDDRKGVFRWISKHRHSRPRCRTCSISRGSLKTLALVNRDNALTYGVEKLGRDIDEDQQDRYFVGRSQLLQFRLGAPQSSRYLRQDRPSLVPARDTRGTQRAELVSARLRRRWLKAPEQRHPMAKRSVHGARPLDLAEVLRSGQRYFSDAAIEEMIAVAGQPAPGPFAISVMLRQRSTVVGKSAEEKRWSIIWRTMLVPWWSHGNTSADRLRASWKRSLRPSRPPLVGFKPSGGGAKIRCRRHADQLAFGRFAALCGEGSSNVEP